MADPKSVNVELQHVAAGAEGKGGHDNPAFSTDGTTQGGVVGVNMPDDPSALRQRSNKQPDSDMDVNNGGKSYAVSRTDDDDDDDDRSDLNPCMRAVDSVQKAVVGVFVRHRVWIVRVVLVLLLLAYLAYFVYAMTREVGDEGSLRLLVCTVLGLVLLALYLAWDFVSRGLDAITPDPSRPGVRTFQRVLPWVLYVVSVAVMVTLLIVLVALDTPSNLISLGGLAAFITISWVTSVNPARVNWHPVFWGFSLQFYFAAIILKTQWGYEAFKWLGDRVTEFLTYANEGAAFVFGADFRIHFFAFALMPVIIFFSSVISVLYYLGVMQGVVSILGRFLSFCLGTTPAESINAAGNIFVGMTEAPLMIRPFISNMTKSELHAVMTGGFATIAGTVLGAYIGFGVPANHLLSASVMSAPAALAISKLTYPETEQTITSAEDYAKMEKGEERNLIEAASSGASNAIMLVANVVVNVIAFLSILKFVNATLTWFGDRVGIKGLTFQFICSYVLYPVAVFMGTEVGPDCRRIGELVGVKTFTNEFIAYEELQVLLKNRETFNNYSTYFNVSDPANVIYDDLDVNLTKWDQLLKGGFLSPRSEVIATYALCGFSNFGSMGIMLGALSAMAPHRRQDMAQIVLRAMIAGNIACFFTACIAGLFYQDFE
ncbi:putative transporter HI_0519 [Babylonia areolata]|uniref:putative transporter HI_0519 n=1 Tax=Babylonia areolata TaxID=304850 RepID=UPI003FD661EE